MYRAIIDGSVDMANANENAPAKMSFKDKVETVQGIVTIIAVFVGAVWTYILFVKERQQFPHAIIDHSISHVALSEGTNLLRVAITLSNTGTASLLSGEAIIRLQQVLPMPSCPEQGSCAKDELNGAAENVVRKQDRFTWPLLAERVAEFKPPLDIEPNEKDFIDYEFALGSKIEVIRVYTYFRNDKRSAEKDQLGWSIASYYDFRNPKSGEGK
jgi:hypothetical protein